MTCTLDFDLVIRLLICYTIFLCRFFLLYRTLFVNTRQKDRVNLSGIVACIEFGQKVFRLWGFRLMEIPHDVSPLLPHLNGFLKIHFSLHTNKRILDLFLVRA